MTTPTSFEPIAQLRAARDRAADAGNLPRALELDNELEDLAQLGTSPRRTCRPCHSWADHVHEPLTGSACPCTAANQPTIPTDLLARFRARQNEIDAHDGEHDGTGEHHDRLAVLHSEAGELMAALDNHLSLGGSLPRAWIHTTSA